MSRQEEDKAILRLFKSKVDAAYWIRGKDSKDCLGMEIVFEDGGRIILESKYLVNVRLIEPIRRDNKGTRK